MSVRLESRRLAAAGDRRAAVSAYRRARAAGDPDARLEEAIFLADGEPAWIDDVPVAERIRLEQELGDVNALSAGARALYTVGAISLGVGALLGILTVASAPTGTIGPCFGCSSAPAPDLTPSYAAAGGIGAGGLVLFFLGVWLDHESGARRNAWRDAVSVARTPGGPITLRISIGDGPTLGVTGSF